MSRRRTKSTLTALRQMLGRCGAVMPTLGAFTDEHVASRDDALLAARTVLPAEEYMALALVILQFDVSWIVRSTAVQGAWTMLGRQARLLFRRALRDSHPIVRTDGVVGLALMREHRNRVLVRRVAHQDGADEVKVVARLGEAFLGEKTIDGARWRVLVAKLSAEEKERVASVACDLLDAGPGASANFLSMLRQSEGVLSTSNAHGRRLITKLHDAEQRRTVSPQH